MNISSYNDIVVNNCNLAPHQLEALTLPNKDAYTLETLLSRKLIKTDNGIEVGSDKYLTKSSCYLIRAKALQGDSYLPSITSDSIVPINPKAFVEYQLLRGDVIISKDSNIGEVVMLEHDYPNYMLSGALYRLPIKKHKYYTFAFLKNDYFKKQLDLKVSKGATIRHAKTVFLDCLVPFPNQKNKSEIIKYIETLALATINKEAELHYKYELIIKTIDQEIHENQKKNDFRYEYPTIRKISDSLRFDTGIYSFEYESFKNLINNYIYGCKDIRSLGFKTKRGQNLQVSCIGRSIYSDSAKPKFYKLITSSDLTNFGTYNNYRYLGNTNRLELINHGDIMFSATGQAVTSVGKICVFVNPPPNLISNINSFFLYRDNFDINSNIYVAMILMYYRYKQYLLKMIGYGNGGSFTDRHFNLIDIPNFKISQQEEIAKLYHNPTTKYSSNLSLDTFLEKDGIWNKQAGILELDRSVKNIKVRLDEIIKNVVCDQRVEIDYSFTSL